MIQAMQRLAKRRRANLGDPDNSPCLEFGGDSPAPVSPGSDVQHAFERLGFGVIATFP